MRAAIIAVAIVDVGGKAGHGLIVHQVLAILQACGTNRVSVTTRNGNAQGIQTQPVGPAGDCVAVRNGHLAAVARQPAATGWRCGIVRPVGTRQHHPRCQRHGHHRGSKPDRRDACARLRACAGALFRNGPDAAQRSRRVVGTGRACGAGRGQATSSAPPARTRRTGHGGDHRRSARPARCLCRRRQCRAGGTARAALALSVAARITAALARRGLALGRHGNVFRPARWRGCE